MVSLCMDKYERKLNPVLSTTCRHCQYTIHQMRYANSDDQIIEEKCDILMIPLPRNVESIEFKIKKFNQLSHPHRLDRNIKYYK